MYYFAFGSNLHKEQMDHRCLNNKPAYKLMIKDYQLLYRNGVATIEYKKGSIVPGIIYKISKADELNLDRYEGYPDYYIKKYFRYKNKTVMFYVLPEAKANISLPSLKYFNTIWTGYNNWNLPIKELFDSLKYTKKIRKKFELKRDMIV